MSYPSVYLPTRGRPKRNDEVPALTTIHDLSANENAYAPLPSVLEVVRAAGERLQRYPDRFCRELTASLAERLAVPAEHIALGVGSVGLIQQFVRSAAGAGEEAPGREVAYGWPSFEAYPHLTRASGAEPVQVPLRAHTFDLDALAGAVTERTRLVFVCNPNNPTGTVVRRAELERFLDRVPERVTVVLDEAYREFVRDAEVPDGIELYRDRPNVAVLRTFSKAYGLAGLRVGYAVANEPVAAALRGQGTPFGINGLAQAAAVASLGAEAELMARVEELVKERGRLVAGLRATGWTVPETEANFLWLPLLEESEAFGAACSAVGVGVRTFPGEGVRITVGAPEANDLVLGVAARLAS
ncbi:histidinol-phosphate transaminase [Kitasatospora sp. McL0602]|uniref:histidinol-phosphate transaminase n=1 Tax=Kitasatospora sp. McL0602 TaxID=3439530 RepID=UPI003F895708